MIEDVLRPSTDAGAALQFAAAVTITFVVGIILRRHRERQLFAVGLGICVVGLIALRAVH